MAILNKTFYKGIDEYNDGDVEQEILDYLRGDKVLTEEDFIGNDFAKAYHLSPIRENILNWYPFDKDEIALEVGAGCGAITGMLCSRLKKVTSVELSLRRSSINYERNKECGNLEIVVGNFNDVELIEKYDYVILNGVLEYAMMFTDTEHPFEDFLRKMVGYLKPDGKLIIAIENKLGLKYFNGSYEDHTNIYFDGINNYQNNDVVRTFSKTELKELLERVGYNHTQFFYPYPDYKFPSEIYSDATINTMGYGKNYINIEKDRMLLFDEKQVGEVLKKEKIRDIFANSFLVVAGKKEINNSVEYAKLNSDRNPKFRIATIINNVNGNRYVIKKSLNSESVNHINNLEEASNTFDTEKISFLNAEKTSDGLCYCFLYKKNLAQMQLPYKTLKKRIIEFFELYCSKLNPTEIEDYRTEQFKEWFGENYLDESEVCVKNANIDLILDNIYYSNNKYIVIDCEWVYTGYVPKKYLLWRCVNEAFYNGNFTSAKKGYNEIILDFNISESEDGIFRKWSNHFALEYVGSYRRNKIAKEMTLVSLNDIREKRNQKNKVLMKLYIDYGSGYSENNTICKMVELINGGKFEVCFEIPDNENIVGLRFDPIDGEFCKCTLNSNTEEIHIIGNNSSFEKDGWEIFMNLDPQYFIQPMDRVCKINGDLKIISKEELVTYL